MAFALPTFPRVVFTIFEPISLLGGFLGAVMDPDWFTNEQIFPAVPVPASVNTDNSRMLALQLGNAYGLLFMLGVAVLYTTSEPKVVRNYLIGLWVADVGHVAFTCYVLGHDKFMAVGDWNQMTWGNVGVTVFLCLTRSAYLLGLFGPDKTTEVDIKKSK